MSEPTFAMRVLDRLADGSMEMDTAVDLFATHAFARDENRRPVLARGGGAFEDSVWSFGDAEFDAITQAYMCSQISYEQYGAFASAAAAPCAPEHQPAPPAGKLRWDRIVTWRTRLARRQIGGAGASTRCCDRGGTTPDAGTVGISRAFVRCLDTEGVLAPFEWQAWMDVRGSELIADQVLLARSSLEDCRRLLAVMLGDRSGPGAYLRPLVVGHVDRALERIERLNEPR